MSRSHLSNFTLLVLACLFIRHYFFYFYGMVVNEFGYDQPFIALILTPTTGMVCCAIFWKNTKFIRLKLDTWLIILSFIGVGLLYSYNLGIIDKYIVYDIYDHSRRPPLYILFPIAIFFILRGSLLTCSFVLAALIYIFEKNFILHYFIIFYLSSQFYPNFKEKLEVPAFCCGLVIIVCIYVFKIERVNIILEFLWITGSLVFLDRVSKLMTVIGLNFGLRPKILIFYLVQAVFFTLVSYFLPELSIFYLIGGFFFCIYFTVTLTKILQNFTDKFL
jgi:hypothetical protein